MKLIPNQFADPKVNLPKDLFLQSIHLLHLSNRLLKELHPLRFCPPSPNQPSPTSKVRGSVDGNPLPNLFADAKVTLTKFLFLL